jgi:probable HAF family extracellular repeat protein
MHDNSPSKWCVRWFLVGLVLLVGPLLSSTPAAGQAYTITDLGDLGGGWSEARAVNRLGQVVGVSTAASGYGHAFLFTKGQILDLGSLGGQWSEANGINDLGQVVGVAEGWPFLITPQDTNGDGTPDRWFDPDPARPGVNRLMVQLSPNIGIAYAINHWSEVVGRLSFAGVYHAFCWSASAGMRDLGTLGNDRWGYAYAINDLGQVVGASTATQVYQPHAFFWSPSTGIVGLGALGGDYSEALDINNRGEIVGWARTSQAERAFLLRPKDTNGDGTPDRWYEGPGPNRLITDLGTFGGDGSTATALNNASVLSNIGLAPEILGTAQASPYISALYLYSGTMRDLLWLVPAGSGWAWFNTAADINDSGQIVGRGLRNNLGHAYLLSPPVASVGLLIQPEEVPGCRGARGTVTLGLPAPAGGASVTLTRSPTLTAASVPLTVTIPAGERSAQFTIDTVPVALDQNGTITASYFGMSAAARFSIRRIGINDLTANPNPVVGGSGATGTVELECPAGPGDIEVFLSSGDVRVAALSMNRILIARNTTRQPFPITTFPVPADTSVTITAIANGQTRSTVLRVVASAKDLVIANPRVASSAVRAGEQVAVSYDIVNRGTATVTETYTERVYLSVDASLDATDVLLGTSNGHTADLPPNASQAFSLALVVPANTVPGSYFVLVQADALGAVGESNETNNVAAAPVTILSAGGPGPSIVRVSGRQLIVQRRRLDGTLEPPAPYTIRGVCWSPASRDTNTTPADRNNANVRRQEFGKWYLTDVPLMARMNVNTVRTFMDFGFDAQMGPLGRRILDALYAQGIMVIMTVDDAVNDQDRVRSAINYYKDHPAILMWMLGSEWNINGYFRGLTPSTAAVRTEDAAKLIKSLDTNHPVGTSYGEIDIDAPGLRLSDTTRYVNEVCGSVDIWSLNIYRGSNFACLFSDWAFITTKPMFIGEFGTDAFRATTLVNPPAGAVDEAMQAQWDLSLWHHLLRHLSARDARKVALGGTVFEWCDEWWKVPPPGSQQTSGFIFDGHPDRFANEESFGIVTIDRVPRQLYSTLATAFHPDYQPPPLTVVYHADSAGDNARDGSPSTYGFARFRRDDARCFFKTGGGGGGRGFNIAVIDPSTGEPLQMTQNFDTWGTRDSGKDAEAMMRFLSGIPNGAIVMIAVADDAGLTLDTLSKSCTSRSTLSGDTWTGRLLSALEALGSKQIRGYCFRDSWAMIAVKGEGRARAEGLGKANMVSIALEFTVP